LVKLPRRIQFGINFENAYVRLFVPMRNTGEISMGKRIGTVSDEARHLLIKSWHPSRMKTGLRNHRIGKKVTVVLVPSSAETRERG